MVELRMTEANADRTWLAVSKLMGPASSYGHPQMPMQRMHAGQLNNEELLAIDKLMEQLCDVLRVRSHTDRNSPRRPWA